MQCPTCKQILEDTVRFCPHDGTPLSETAATQTDLTPTGGKRTSSRELPLPLVIGARYRLEELRGGGGMAKVYRAVDITLEREVAVKLINPELRNEPEFDVRFQREARIASQLADPHIVVVHDFGLDPAHGPFLVMEYLQGESLRERLASKGPMPLKAGLQLAGQLFLALVHAHNKGIVHRDIKPDNIFLLNQSGVRLHTRVLDFGIARIYRGDENSKSETITHAGAVLGTPRYMSPEQLAGQPVDARSDLYSAALVIYEALTGQLPYLHGKKLCELCPEASVGLQELIEQCLKPSPDERPLTAVEVYLRLQELGKASGILLLPPGSLDKLVAARKSNEPTVPYVPPEQTQRHRKRRVLLGIGLMILLGGSAALASWWFFSRPAILPGPERFYGLRIGDAEQDEKSKGWKVTDGDPWQNVRTSAMMRPVLRPEDLGLTEAERSGLRVYYDRKDQVFTLRRQNVLVGILTTEPGVSTNRGVKVGSDVRLVEERYGKELRERQEIVLPGGRQVEVWRFPWLGLALEIQDGRVTALALFPAKR